MSMISAVFVAVLPPFDFDGLPPATITFSCPGSNTCGAKYRSPKLLAATNVHVFVLGLNEYVCCEGTDIKTFPLGIRDTRAYGSNTAFGTFAESGSAVQPPVS